MALTTWLYRIVGSRFRKRRMDWFLGEFGNCHTVLDVGGELHAWQGHRPAHLTIVNLGPRPVDLDGSVVYVQGDGRALTFPDGSFDLSYSNSVIEHVGNWDEQKHFAQEMQRVGRRVYCQTPNKFFPLDTHSLGPLVHWFPASKLSALVYRYFTLQGLRVKPRREECLARIRSVRHLTRKELVQLFPCHNIRTERFAGLAKSFIVWR